MSRDMNATVVKFLLHGTSVRSVDVVSRTRLSMNSSHTLKNITLGTPKMDVKQMNVVPQKVHDALDGIMMGFNWRDSPEGFRYWENIYKKLSYIYYSALNQENKNKPENENKTPP